jgi:hypothetical protein
MKYRYQLLNTQTGKVAALCHQDDSESPIESSSLHGLFGKIEKWSDMSIGDALVEMEKGGEFAGHQIVRQQVVLRSTRLSPTDLKTIKKEMDETKAEDARQDAENKARREAWGKEEAEKAKAKETP